MSKFRIVAGPYLLVPVSGVPRLAVVVDLPDMSRRAFYMSSGRGGETEQGEWAPFYGARWHEWAKSAWLVKESRKRPPVGSLAEEVCTWLGDYKNWSEPCSEEERGDFFGAIILRIDHQEGVDNLNAILEQAGVDL